MWVSSTSRSTNAVAAERVRQRQVAALSIHISGVSIDEAALHPEVERKLHRLDRVVAAVGIAGEVGLAHAGDRYLTPRR